MPIVAPHDDDTKKPGNGVLAPQRGTNKPSPKPPKPKEPAPGITWPTPSRRLTSVHGAHHGLDIDGQSGDPVVAPVSGQVIFAGDASESGYGGLVIVQDSLGRKHYLAHLRRIDVKPGDVVDVGTFLGEMGGGAQDPMQGNSTGSHLHYEVRLGSAQLDPLQLFGNVPGEYGGVTVAPPPSASSYTGPDTSSPDTSSPDEEPGTGNTSRPGGAVGMPGGTKPGTVPERKPVENPIANALGLDPDDPLGLKKIDWGRVAVAMVGAGLIIVGVLTLAGEEAIGAAAGKLAKPIAEALAGGRE